MESPSDLTVTSLSISFMRSSSAPLLPVDIVSGDFLKVGEPHGVSNSSSGDRTDEGRKLEAAAVLPRSFDSSVMVS